MFDFKNPVYSKTVIFALIGLVSALLNLDLDKVEAGEVADQVYTIVTALSLLGAIYGRFKAKKQLSFKVKSKE